jgi:hypothetical protein
VRGRAALLDRGLERRGAAAAGRGRRVDDHPILQLQRAAGNQAVGSLVVQHTKAEDEATYFDSAVVEAIPGPNYRGKTNAEFTGVRLEKNWEFGLLMNDIAIVFQCGRQRFRFEATESYSGGMPWTMLDAKGGAGGFAKPPIQSALNTLYNHWDDDKRFGPASRVVIDALRHDVEAYRSLEEQYRTSHPASVGANLGSSSARTDGPPTPKPFWFGN